MKKQPISKQDLDNTIEEAQIRGKRIVIEHRNLESELEAILADTAANIARKSGLETAMPPSETRERKLDVIYDQGLPSDIIQLCKELGLEVIDEQNDDGSAIQALAGFRFTNTSGTKIETETYSGETIQTTLPLFYIRNTALIASIKLHQLLTGMIEQKDLDLVNLRSKKLKLLGSEVNNWLASLLICLIENVDIADEEGNTISPSGISNTQKFVSTVLQSFSNLVFDYASKLNTASSELQEKSRIREAGVLSTLSTYLWLKQKLDINLRLPTTLEESLSKDLVDEAGTNYQVKSLRTLGGNQVITFDGADITNLEIFITENFNGTVLETLKKEMFLIASRVQEGSPYTWIFISPSHFMQPQYAK